MTSTCIETKAPNYLFVVCNADLENCWTEWRVTYIIVFLSLPDVDLLVCKHQGPSCCTRKMEESYQFAVRRETLHNIYLYSYELKHLIARHSDAFQGKYKDYKSGFGLSWMDLSEHGFEVHVWWARRDLSSTFCSCFWCLIDVLLNFWPRHRKSFDLSALPVFFFFPFAELLLKMLWRRGMLSICVDVTWLYRPSAFSEFELISWRIDESAFLGCINVYIFAMRWVKYSVDTSAWYVQDAQEYFFLSAHLTTAREQCGLNLNISSLKVAQSHTVQEIYFWVLCVIVRVLSKAYNYSEKTIGCLDTGHVLPHDEWADATYVAHNYGKKAGNGICQN